MQNPPPLFSTTACRQQQHDRPCDVVTNQCRLLICVTPSTCPQQPFLAHDVVDARSKSAYSLTFGFGPPTISLIDPADQKPAAAGGAAMLLLPPAAAEAAPRGGRGGEYRPPHAEAAPPNDAAAAVAAAAIRCRRRRRRRRRGSRHHHHLGGPRRRHALHRRARGGEEGVLAPGEAGGERVDARAEDAGAGTGGGRRGGGAAAAAAGREEGRGVGGVGARRGVVGPVTCFVANSQGGYEWTKKRHWSRQEQPLCGGILARGSGGGQ